MNLRAARVLICVAALSAASGDLAPDKSWRFTARKAGEMHYICRLHPVMKGVLVVKALKGAAR